MNALGDVVPPPVAEGSYAGRGGDVRAVSSVDLGRALGRNPTVVWRWLRVIGHERAAHQWPTADISEREALAVYVGHRYGRSDLGRLMARTIARTSYAWLFVSLAPTCPEAGVVLGANTAEELLRLWRQVDTPVGVVLNLEHLATEVAALLEPIPA